MMTIKKKQAALSLVLLCLATAVLFAAFYTVGYGGAIRLESKPSYEILNRWYDKNEKKVALDEVICDAPLLLHTDLHSERQREKLIFCVENMSVMAYTKGKILLNETPSKDFSGRLYRIIDISEVQQDEPIFLLLKPLDGKTGRLKSKAMLTTQNDFLLALLLKNSGLLIIVIALIGAALLAFFRFLHCRTHQNTYSPQPLFLSALTLCTALLCLCDSDLAQCLWQSGRYILIMKIVSLSTLIMILPLWIWHKKRATS